MGGVPRKFARASRINSEKFIISAMLQKTSYDPEKTIQHNAKQQHSSNILNINTGEAIGNDIMRNVDELTFSTGNSLNDLIGHRLI